MPMQFGTEAVYFSFAVIGIIAYFLDTKLRVSPRIFVFLLFKMGLYSSKNNIIFVFTFNLHYFCTRNYIRVSD